MNMETRTISIIIPTLNESGNIQTLLSEIIEMSRMNPGLNIRELVIVDDGSTDGTQQIVQNFSQKTEYPVVKLIERNGKFGLLSAQVDGAKSTTSEKILIMDGDLQHPIEIIPKLIMSSIGKDLVVASRYNGGKSLRNPMRGLISRVATSICHAALPSTAIVKDPLSGFFIVRRRFITDLKPTYKIKIKMLPYIMASHRTLDVCEVPYCFIERENGHSKIVDRKFKFIFDYTSDVILMMKASRDSRTVSIQSYAQGPSGNPRVQKRDNS